MLPWYQQPDEPLRVRGQLHRAEGRVVAADGDELAHTQALQGVERGFQQLLILGRVGARGAQVRATPEVQARDGVDVERSGGFDVALHQPGKAVLDAEHLPAREAGADGGGADHAVDARRWSSADEDGELVFRLH